MVSNKYTILVNSSDGFSDCWTPFFALLDNYWPNHDSVLLNTENTDWAEAPDYCSCTRIALNEYEKISWSECLIKALEKIDTEFVLYFQEDYFLDAPVRVDVLVGALSTISNDKNIACIGLSAHGAHPPYEQNLFKGYIRVRQRSRYIVSTQVSLWRRTSLISYLRPKENGWEFEIFGSLRACFSNEIFLLAPYSSMDGGPAFSYIHTGIIKGRWHPLVPKLFSSHGIDLDFTRRGFFVFKGRLESKYQVLKRLLYRPINLINIFCEIFMLFVKNAK